MRSRRRAGGNPLFLLQLVASAQAGESADELPESIERVVATRIDRLDPADRALLRQAAVVGRVFDAGVLDALRADRGCRGARGAATGTRWPSWSSRARAGRWRFRHALFRDVAYEGLPFARRRRMHRDVGELLEAGVAGEPDIALLSVHFWLAGDAERTWRYSVAAGDAGLAGVRGGRVDRGVQTGPRGAAASPGLPPSEVAGAAEALGDVLERAARYDEADAAYTLARRAARETETGTAEQCAGCCASGPSLASGQGGTATRSRWYRASTVIGLGDLRRRGRSAELARGRARPGGSVAAHRQGAPSDLAGWAERGDRARSA